MGPGVERIEKTMDELLEPADSRCAEIRNLMLAEAERDLTGFESKRLEKHINECSACQSVLAGEGTSEVVDRLLREIPIEYPDEAAWSSLQERIHEAVGQAAPSPTAPAPHRPERVSPLAWARVLVPLAAMILICFLVIRSISDVGWSETRNREFVIEVTELPDDMEAIILYPEAEDGAIMITLTSG